MQHAKTLPGSSGKERQANRQTFVIQEPPGFSHGETQYREFFMGLSLPRMQMRY